MPKIDSPSTEIDGNDDSDVVSRASTPSAEWARIKEDLDKMDAAAAEELMETKEWEVVQSPFYTEFTIPADFFSSKPKFARNIRVENNQNMPAPTNMGNDDESIGRGGGNVAIERQDHADNVGAAALPEASTSNDTMAQRDIALTSTAAGSVFNVDGIKSSTPANKGSPRRIWRRKSSFMNVTTTLKVEVKTVDVQADIVEDDACPEPSYDKMAERALASTLTVSVV